MLIPLDLAPLSDDERAHEARLAADLRAEIAAAGGWISFARFMERVLYAPGLGYYAAGAHKLGAGGDFITAPELSPVFGRCVASQCAEVLASLGGGGILELGAGTGSLAVEVLRELERVGVLPERYEILEPSPDLRARQQQAVASLRPALRDRVVWLDRIPVEPFRGVLLANEVLDALPVERFRIAASGAVESLGVCVAGAGFGWSARPASAELAAAVADLGVVLPTGFVSELALRQGAWLASVTAPLGAGVALFFDYGLRRADYYAADRDGGTLACFHRHRRHDDVFANLGLQDLTAWVDFTRVAEGALDAGLEVAGYTTQAHFLLGTGFESHLAALRAQTDPAREPLCAGAAARLVLPSEMGERFKCIALAREYPGGLAGFRLRDFTAAL